MGRAKDELIEKERKERECPECGATVWVEWRDSPNVSCGECGFEGDVKQCENCTNLISIHSDDIMCENCVEYQMRD